MKQKFKFLEHTADIKFQAFGKTIEKVFENSALALKESISEDKINSKEKRKIEATGKDLEELLYNFLEEFLVLFDNEGFVLSQMGGLDIEKKDGKYKLEARVSGDLQKEEGYEISNHVKAITYNDMFVKKEKDNTWIVQVVVDV